MKNKRPCLPNFHHILTALLTACAATAMAEGAPSAIDPLDYVRGQRLSERVGQLVPFSRGMAEVGLGYEAARMLKAVISHSPDGDQANEANQLLKSWGIDQLDITDTNAAVINGTIRKHLVRNRQALIDLKRVETLLAIGRTGEAAPLVEAALAVELTGESSEIQKNILAGFSLSAQELKEANGTDAIKARLAKSVTINRLADTAEFLRTAHPDSGDAMTVLIKKVYPESQRRAQARSSEQERFRRSFSRRLPENARPPALRVEDDGERGGGRGGSFSFLSSRSERGEREAASLLSAGELAEIAGDLGNYDAGSAREFADLAKRAQDTEADRKLLDDALNRLAKRGPLQAVPTAKPPGRFLKPIRGDDEASPVFNGQRVPEYRLVLSPESIESLKKEPKAYTKATFICGDVQLKNVGIRLKGFIGSFRPFDGQNKNGFTVKFNAFKKGQRFLGLKKMQLNNAAQDASFIRERLGYALFRQAGLPAPRVGHATVVVNDQPFGLYVQVEAATTDFLARWFEDTGGDLYEGPTDITNWKNLDLDSDPDNAKRGLLLAFSRAAEEAADARDLTPLREWLDLGHFARFLAMEIVTDHWDGYVSPNNYRVYRNPTDGKFYFIPHGADQLFRNSANSLHGSSRGRSVVTEAFRSSEEGRQLIEESMRYLLATVWNPALLEEQARQDYERLHPHIVADPKRPYDLMEVEDRVKNTLEYFRKADRIKRWQLLALEDPDLEDRLSRMSSRSRWGGFGGRIRR